MVVMKNWEPLLSGPAAANATKVSVSRAEPRVREQLRAPRGNAPELAMESSPGAVCFSCGGAARERGAVQTRLSEELRCCRCGARAWKDSSAKAPPYTLRPPMPSADVKSPPCAPRQRLRAAAGGAGEGAQGFVTWIMKALMTRWNCEPW